MALDTGPSSEMRRFSAGMRVVTALLCTTLLLENEPELEPAAVSVLLGYCAWSGGVLWSWGADRIGRRKGFNRGDLMADRVSVQL